jgi:hypothetical protein
VDWDFTVRDREKLAVSNFDRSLKFTAITPQFPVTLLLTWEPKKPQYSVHNPYAYGEGNWVNLTEVYGQHDRNGRLNT